MLEKEKDLILEIGEQSSNPHGMPFTEIKKKCQERELVFDDIMSMLRAIKCFEIVPPTNSQYRIKVGYKNSWQKVIIEYFDKINHDESIIQRQELNLELSNAEMKRNKWISLLALCISAASLLVAIISLCRNA